jgi:hypothetical protein
MCYNTTDNNLLFQEFAANAGQRSMVVGGASGYAVNRFFLFHAKSCL